MPAMQPFEASRSNRLLKRHHSPEDVTLIRLTFICTFANSSETVRVTMGSARNLLSVLQCTRHRLANELPECCLSVTNLYYSCIRPDTLMACFFQLNNYPYSSFHIKTYFKITQNPNAGGTYMNDRIKLLPLFF